MDRVFVERGHRSVAADFNGWTELDGWEEPTRRLGWGDLRDRQVSNHVQCFGFSLCFFAGDFCVFSGCV